MYQIISVNHEMYLNTSRYISNERRAEDSDLRIESVEEEPHSHVSASFIAQELNDAARKNDILKKDRRYYMWRYVGNSTF